MEINKMKKTITVLLIISLFILNVSCKEKKQVSITENQILDAFFSENDIEAIRKYTNAELLQEQFNFEKYGIESIGQIENGNEKIYLTSYSLNGFLEKGELLFLWKEIKNKKQERKFYFIDAVHVPGKDGYYILERNLFYDIIPEKKEWKIDENRYGVAYSNVSESFMDKLLKPSYIISFTKEKIILDKPKAEDAKYYVYYCSGDGE